MSTEAWITLAGVVAAVVVAAITTAYRFRRDRHSNLTREWTVLQSLADELRMNWYLIRLDSHIPQYQAWLSFVNNRRWIPVKSKDYYDLLGLYSFLISVTDEVRQISIRQARTRFRELEPWVAAWWSHLQSEAERWRHRLDDLWSWADLWLWLKWLFAFAPEKAEGPSEWQGSFRPVHTQNTTPSRDPAEVREVVLGHRDDGRPWLRSIYSKTLANGPRRGFQRWLPWSR